MSKKIYEKASPEIHDLVKQIMETYHSQLYDLEVKVAITMVSKFDTEDQLLPCLRLHGNAAFAVIHLVRGSQRVHVNHDAEISIDAFNWTNANEETRIAVIDHELEHIIIAKDRHGIVKKDDNDHVKLRMKADDYALTGFYAVIERHGINSAECISIHPVSLRINEAVEANTRSLTTNASTTLQPAGAAA
jgi:hypothetical protein